MMRASGRLLAMAGVLLALATALAAIGTHVLPARLAPERLSLFEVGVQFQFFHSLGLLGMGVAARSMDSAALRWAAGLLLIGIILFSGSLYLLSFGAPRGISVVPPLGGLLLIGAWLLFAVAAWRSRQS